jgi:hypothetical protein
MGCFMKYHLSTLLLAMVIVALGLGWYLDHHDPKRTEIVGTWYYPYKSLPYGQVGYHTTLTINEDGTFRKTEMGREGSEIYEGTYRMEKDGSIFFHVTKKTVKSDFHKIAVELSKQMNLPAPPDHSPVTLHMQFKIRCAVDKSGFLLLDNQSFQFGEQKDECKISWDRSYERSK